MKAQAIVFPAALLLQVAVLVYSGCAAVKETAGIATDAAIVTADERVGDLLLDALKDYPELVKQLRADAAERRAAGSKTPWIATALASVWSIVMTLLFGNKAVGLRKLSPLKSAIEAVSRAIGRYSEKNGGAVELKKEIDKAVEEHPELADDASIRDVMKKAGALPG